MEILEKMEYITLNNGVKMPMAGLGTFLLSPDEAQESVYAALKEGYQLIDNVNEEEVGEAIQESGIPREEIFLTTKVWVEHYSEHRKWVALEQELQAQGYSLEEVQALRRHYKEEYSEVCAKEKVVFRELNTGKAILNSMIPDSISDGRKTEYNREIIRDRKEQPVR